MSVSGAGMLAEAHKDNRPKVIRYGDDDGPLLLSEYRRSRCSWPDLSALYRHPCPPLPNSFEVDGMLTAQAAFVASDRCIAAQSAYEPFRQIWFAKRLPGNST